MTKDFSKIFIINQKSNFTEMCKRFQLKKPPKAGKNSLALKEKIEVLTRGGEISPPLGPRRVNE